MIDRTGEIGDPCGVPTSRERGSAVSPLKRREMRQSVRNDLSQLTKGFGKPILSKIQTKVGVTKNQHPLYKL